ncbi:MAG: hypothetical protein AB1421_07605 [Pseudomonadota bacterium]
MKFPQLPIGTRFEYDGKVYVKTGPIAASGEDGGQRMIPRYAPLRVLDGYTPPPPKPRPSTLDSAEVRQAFEAFYRASDRILDDGLEDDAALARARQKLALARGEFLAALGYEDEENADDLAG